MKTIFVTIKMDRFFVLLSSHVQQNEVFADEKVYFVSQFSQCAYQFEVEKK